MVLASSPRPSGNTPTFGTRRDARTPPARAKCSSRSCAIVLGAIGGSAASGRSLAGARHAAGAAGESIRPSGTIVPGAGRPSASRETPGTAKNPRQRSGCGLYGPFAGQPSPSPRCSGTIDRAEECRRPTGDGPAHLARATDHFLLPGGLRRRGRPWPAWERRSPRRSAVDRLPAPVYHFVI